MSNSTDHTIPYENEVDDESERTRAEEYAKLKKELMKDISTNIITDIRKVIQDELQRRPLETMDPNTSAEGEKTPSRDGSEAGNIPGQTGGQQHNNDDAISIFPNESLLGKRKERDMDSLFGVDENTPKKPKQSEEQEVDMAAELFNALDETMRKNQEEDLGNNVNESLAKRLKQYWDEFSSDHKVRKKIYDAYKMPKNLDVKVTELNKEISSMDRFEAYHSRIDKDYKEIQFMVTKCLQIVAQLADDALTADKNSTVISARDVVSKVLDVAVVLGQANSRLNNKRKNAIKGILHQDVQHLCNERTPSGSKCLFGDDFVKSIEEAKKVKAAARSASAPKTNTASKHPPTAANKEKKPFLGQGQNQNRPPGKASNFTPTSKKGGRSPQSKSNSHYSHKKHTSRR